MYDHDHAHDDGTLNEQDLFFPNRSLLQRVLILHQRGGGTETHRKRDLASDTETSAAANSVLKLIDDSHCFEFFALHFSSTEKVYLEFVVFGVFASFLIFFCVCADL